MTRPPNLTDLLLAGVSAHDLREAAAHYRAVAERPENAAIKEQILRIAERFEERASSMKLAGEA